MPELPEVETTIRGLKPIVNSTIHTIEIHTPKLRFFIPKKITRIKKGINFKNVSRIGKYIFIHLNNNNTIIIHLGMSGRLRLINKNKFNKQKHDHFIIRTNQDQCLIFNDSRKFGFIDYTSKNNVFKKRYILNLGKDALSVSMTGKYLFLKINKSVVPIKQILLNQSIIAGIGNIYASEILFNARISPFRRGKDFTLEESNQLVSSIKKILKMAIKAGGSTLRDYVSADGIVGNYQGNFRVYGKDGQKILGKIIKKIVQYGRSTYYCPKIQNK
jgi:formamidopyrimidine-DNA glycosylase